MIRYTAGEPRAKRGSRSVGLYVLFGLVVAVYILLHAVRLFIVAGPQPTPRPTALSDFMVKSIIRNVIDVREAAEDGKLEVGYSHSLSPLVDVFTFLSTL